MYEAILKFNMKTIIERARENIRRNNGRNFPNLVKY